MKRKRDRLELQPITGRVDVLFYRLAESTAKMIEKRVAVGGLWEMVRDDIEELIVQEIGPNRTIDPNYMHLFKKILEAKRKMGGMS